MTQELQKGDAVQVMPHTALWASGARFGEVLATRKGNTSVLVHLDTGKRDWCAISTVLEA
jgi:hypothetical protein